MPRRDLAVLCAVLLLAALLRFERLDLAQFKNDEARALSLAAQIAEGESFPLVGIPSSAGPQNGPGFPYLLALPLLIRRDALFATGFVAALNVAAVGLTYVLVRRHFGAAAAGIGALLFAAGFWPVTFSRFLWAQNVLPFFSALLGLALFEAIARGRRWLFPVAAAMVGLMAQLHFSALAFLPFVVLLGALFYRRLRAAAIVAAPAFLLALAPYLVGEASHGGENLRHMRDVTAGAFSLHMEPLIEPLRLLGSDGYDRWLGESQALQGAATARLWANGLVAALALVGLGRTLTLTLSQREREHGQPARSPSASRQTCLLLGLWVIVPIGMFLYTPFPVYEHYFIGFLPVLFALVGVGGASVVALAWPSPGPRWRLAGIATSMAVLLGVGLAAGSQVAFNRAALDAQEGEVRPIGRGVPLGDLREVMRLLTAVPDSDRWLITREDLREPLSALSRLGGTATPLGGDALVASRSPQQAYLMIEGSGAGGDFLDLNVASFLTAKRETPSPAAIFRLYVVPTELMDAAARQGASVERTTTAGIELLSLLVEDTARQGAILSVRLGWTVRETPPSPRKRYRFFAHLVADPASPPLAQEDRIGYASERWERGDLVITWLPIALPSTLPPGDYRLRIGMYDLDTSNPAPFLGDDGQPREAWLLFGPVRVTP